jgi:hypothetical protein
MARFETAILANKLLRPAIREAMWTPQKAADSSRNGYALGWGTQKKYGLALAGHAGIVVLANMDNVDAGELSTDILEIVLGLKDQPE